MSGAKGWIKTVSDAGALYKLEPFMTPQCRVEDAGFVASGYAMRNATETKLDTNHPFRFDQEAIGILFRLEAEGPFELRTPNVVLSSTPVSGRPTHVIYFARGCPVGILRYHMCEVVSTAVDSVSVLCYSLNPGESRNAFPDFSGFMWAPVTSSKSGRFQAFGMSARSNGLMFMYGREEEREETSEEKTVEKTVETEKAAGETEKKEEEEKAQ